MRITVNDKMSINEALKSVKPGDELYLEKGTYNEKVEVLIDDITIIGEDAKTTIIQNKDYFHKIMSDYNSCNTFRTFTMYIGGKNITLKNITIKNLSTPSEKYGQAVALHVDSDNFLCEDVILSGAQDTLFTGPIPYFLRERLKNFLPQVFRREYIAKQVFKNCLIMGDVDFIFGNSTALFYNCEIRNIRRNSCKSNVGYVCAPSHEINQKFGYLFYKCNFTAEDGVSNIYLARPWGKYGRVAFIDNKLGNHINKEGFSIWDGTKRHETATFIEAEDYDLSKRPNWAILLEDEEKKTYVKDFLENINYKL